MFLVIMGQFILLSRENGPLFSRDNEIICHKKTISAGSRSAPICEVAAGLVLFYDKVWSACYLETERHNAMPIRPSLMTCTSWILGHWSDHFQFGSVAGVIDKLRYKKKKKLMALKNIIAQPFCGFHSSQHWLTMRHIISCLLIATYLAL